MIKPGTLIGPWRNLGPSYPDNIIGKSGQVMALIDKTHPSWKENAKAIQALPDLLEALELLFHGCEQAKKDGLNQPQVNGGMILAKSALIKAGYTF